jgi:hypothetical protein
MNYAHIMRIKKAANPFRLAAFLFAARSVYFLPGGKSVQLPAHLRRHADAFAQRGVRMNGFADVHGVGAHGNIKKCTF